MRVSQCGRILELWFKDGNTELSSLHIKMFSPKPKPDLHRITVSSCQTQTQPPSQVAVYLKVITQPPHPDPEISGVMTHAY